MMSLQVEPAANEHNVGCDAAPLGLAIHAFTGCQMSGEVLGVRGPLQQVV